MHGEIIQPIALSRSLSRGVEMTPFGDYRAKLIEIAERIASDGAKDNLDFLRGGEGRYDKCIGDVGDFYGGGCEIVDKVSN